MSRDPGGRPPKVLRKEPSRDWLEPAEPAERSTRTVRRPRNLKSTVFLVESFDAPWILAPPGSRFRSAQYRREILCELRSWHHVLAPRRARTFRQLGLHLR